MGSEFCSFLEAANALGRSKRSVHNYIKRGFLKRYHQDGEVVLSRKEVEELAVASGQNMPPFTKANFFHLVSRVQKLEQDMVVVRKALDIRSDPLRPNPDTAKGFYVACRAALASDQPHEFKEILMWSELMPRMDEVTFETMAEASGDKNPWYPFYRLSVKLLGQVSKEETFNTNLELQTLHKILDESRKKLRETGILWVELGKTYIQDLLTPTPSGGRTGVLQKLQKTAK